LPPPDANPDVGLAVFVGMAVGNGQSPQHTLYYAPYIALVNAIKSARATGMIVTRDTPTPSIIARIRDFIYTMRRDPHWKYDKFHPQLHRMILAAALHVMDTEDE